MNSEQESLWYPNAILDLARKLDPSCDTDIRESKQIPNGYVIEQGTSSMVSSSVVTNKDSFNYWEVLELVLKYGAVSMYYQLTTTIKIIRDISTDYISVELFYLIIGLAVNRYHVMAVYTRPFHRTRQNWPYIAQLANTMTLRPMVACSMPIERALPPPCSWSVLTLASESSYWWCSSITTFLHLWPTWQQPLNHGVSRGWHLSATYRQIKALTEALDPFDQFKSSVAHSAAASGYASLHRGDSVDN